MPIAKAARLSLLAALLAVPTAPLFAGTLAGVTLPDKAEAKGQSLVLNGLGLRKKFVIKVYVGGLYLPQKEKNPQKILGGDGAKPQRGTDQRGAVRARPSPCAHENLEDVGDQAGASL